MTNRTGAHIAWSQVASVAAAETRLALRAAPGVIRHLAPIAAWAAVSIIMGVVVGFAAVALPPLVAFGIVAVVALVLLWVMPEVSTRLPGADSQDLLHYAGRRSLRSFLLYSTGEWTALDFRSPPCDVLPHSAVLSCNFLFV